MGELSEASLSFSEVAATRLMSRIGQCPPPNVTKRHWLQNRTVADRFAR